MGRREALVAAYKEKYDAADIYECPICIVESEIHMVQALEDIRKAGCNALVVYLGNFGPEISETCWQSILTVRKCLLLQQRRVKTTWSRDAEMLIAVC